MNEQSSGQEAQADFLTLLENKLDTFQKQMVAFQREVLENQNRRFQEMVDQQERKFRNLEEGLDRNERRIAAIQSFPLPYERPSVFHAATERHSVSQPVRTNQGHYG